MRQLGAVAAVAISLAVPATAAGDYPGQRPWQEPAVTDPYMAAADAAIKRIYPADARHCATGIALFLADDLGAPATASGGSCTIVMGAVWLPSAYGRAPAHKRLLCTVFAHERAHAELNRPHVEDPADLMYPGPLTVVLPECVAAFPDPTDGFVPPGRGSVTPTAPDNVADVTERVCVPAWAAHSTGKVGRQYARFHRRTAWRLYTRWARERPGRAARARAQGRKCTTVVVAPK
jgi:hypothetical protein